MIEAARTVQRHWDGVLRWFDSKIANGLIEGDGVSSDDKILNPVRVQDGQEFVEVWVHR